MILTPVLQFNAVTSSTNISFEVVDDDVFENTEKFTVSANPSTDPYHGVRISVEFQSIVLSILDNEGKVGHQHVFGSVDLSNSQWLAIIQ